MKPAPFDYHRPTSLDEALALLAAHPEAKVLAGGQSLLPLLSMRLASPPALVDLAAVRELDTLGVDDHGLTFGAMVRHTRLLRDADVARVQPLVPRALALVAHPTIRNRGTTLGSIVHADAAAEMPMVLRLLGGTVRVRSSTASRTVAADELFVGPLETSLRSGELAVSAWLPSLATGHGVAVDEVSRRHGDYALCGVGAVVGTSPDDGRVTFARVGYLSVCDTPAVVDVSEVFAAGEVSEAALDGAVELGLAAIDPTADIHASADYRRHLAAVLTRRVLLAAHADALARTAALR